MKAEAESQPAPFGVLLIDKPSGPTSHDVVAFVRWALRERAVGHCGTLDPAATGMLVVCVGAATKLVEHLTGVDKRYRARFVLGRSTTTADGEGETLVEQAVPVGVEDRVADELAAMIGELDLPPPAYSAIKLAGRRAHELARAGEVVDMPLRRMLIHALEAIEVARDPERSDRVLVDATLDVGKGTYVRSIAEALGRRLGVPAHLGGLRRLACGPLDLQRPEAVSGLIAESLGSAPGQGPRWRIHLGESGEAGRAMAGQVLRDRLIMPWTCLPFETRVLVESEASTGLLAYLLAHLRNGQRMKFDARARAALGLADVDGPCAVALPDTGELLIAGRREGRLAPDRWIRFEPIRPAPRG
ncbi:tRNA pseudouridine(55) synthase TruB [Nannocystaceae bacterium ST9]